jgi:hypothetical protein
MIGFTRYVRCDCCYMQMLGIISDTARRTCHRCGGSALIGQTPSYRDRLRRARERIGRWMPEPRRPRTPRAA